MPTAIVCGDIYSLLLTALLNVCRRWILRYYCPANTREYLWPLKFPIYCQLNGRCVGVVESNWTYRRIRLDQAKLIFCIFKNTHPRLIVNTVYRDFLLFIIQGFISIYKIVLYFVKHCTLLITISEIKS